MPGRRRTHLVVAALFVAFISGLAIKRKLNEDGLYVEKYIDGRVIPPGGLLVNPHGLSGLKGDAEDDLRRLGGALSTYAKERGRLPDDPRELIAYTRGWPEGKRVGPEHFGTDDLAKADDSTRETSFGYSWLWRGPRRDGSPRPAVPKAGERDAWISTEVYAREGKTVFRDGTFQTQPTGHLLVYFSDGELEKIPLADALVRTPMRNHESSILIRGETGTDKAVLPGSQATRGKWWPPPGAPASLY